MSEDFFSPHQASKNWNQGGCEHCKRVSKIISRLMQKIFTQSISHSTTAIFQTRVNAISFYYPNYSHHCQGDLLECHWHTTWNSYQKYSPLKEPNQWHKSCIVYNSLVSCNIPLYCVFIIPLNRIYGVAQVERSHAWTFFTVCFVEWVQKESNHWYSWHSQYEVWQYFFVCANLWVYMVIPEQPQTSTAVGVVEGGWVGGGDSLFSPHRLCKIKNHSLRSHNFLLKHNFLPVHLLLCCRENAEVIVGLAWTMFLLN